MRDLTIYTDGSVYPNPGGVGGWAFVAIDFDGPGKNYEYTGWAPNTTNNRMELTAAINALGMAERGDLVTIITDSQYVQRCFARLRWPSTKPNADLGRHLAEIKRGRFYEVKLVAGHSGDKWNDRAHELANKVRLEGVEYTKQTAADEKRRPKKKSVYAQIVESNIPERAVWAYSRPETVEPVQATTSVNPLPSGYRTGNIWSAGGISRRIHSTASIPVETVSEF